MMLLIMVVPPSLTPLKLLVLIVLCVIMFKIIVLPVVKQQIIHGLTLLNVMEMHLIALRDSMDGTQMVQQHVN